MQKVRSCALSKCLWSDGSFGKCYLESQLWIKQFNVRRCKLAFFAASLWKYTVSSSGSSSQFLLIFLLKKLQVRSLSSVITISSRSALHMGHYSASRINLIRSEHVWHTFVWPHGPRAKNLISLKHKIQLSPPSMLRSLTPLSLRVLFPSGPSIEFVLIIFEK